MDNVEDLRHRAVVPGIRQATVGVFDGCVNREIAIPAHRPEKEGVDLRIVRHVQGERLGGRTNQSCHSVGLGLQLDVDCVKQSSRNRNGIDACSRQHVRPGSDGPIVKCIQRHATHGVGILSEFQVDVQPIAKG